MGETIGKCTFSEGERYQEVKLSLMHEKEKWTRLDPKEKRAH